MPTRKASVLVVEDDIRIMRMLGRMLELEGYRVCKASNGEAALQLLDEESVDLVLLDIMLPDIDGYAVCQRIRDFSQIPIIMVTAKSGNQEKIQGLDAGADDYITKPFSTGEVAARVRSVLRRTTSWNNHPKPAFRLKKLRVDFARHRVFLNNWEIKLTSLEFKLLSYLARNAGRVLTPDQILEGVWGSEYIGELHLVQALVSRVRGKLDDNAKDPKYILTRPSIGYMMPGNAYSRRSPI